MRYYEAPEPPSPMDRVEALAEHLGILAGRVREAVAEAVGETLARLARDAAERFLGPHAAPQPVIQRYGSQSYYEGDPWADPDPDPPYYPTGESSMEATQRMAVGKAIAAGLATAGWWLRRGQPWAAVGAGAAVAVGSAGRGKLGRAGQAVTGAVADLIVVAVPLAKRVSGRPQP